MVEREELPTGQDPERSSARARTTLLQKRFQEVITNIIKDTQETFSSLLGDLDQGKQSVSELPRPLRPQVTDGFHCQMARKSCKVQKQRESYAEEASGGCFDILSHVTSGCCRQNDPSFNEASASSSNINRYEASLRLERLIKEKLESRMEIIKDNGHHGLYPSQSRSKLVSSITTGFELSEDENRTSEERLDSLIKDELNWMKISSDIRQDDLNRINARMEKNDERRNSQEIVEGILT